MNYSEESLYVHGRHRGKIEVTSKVSLRDAVDLSIAYTPGVAEPCRKIHENRGLVYDYTAKGNLVAVVSDGSAVLGLGDIGPEAAMPVMEGKALLFKNFGEVDAFPICLATKNVDEIVALVKNLEPTFGGINIEDISSPRCFEIEERLKKVMDIPVFHDDQHGTAVVVTAGVINALKLKGMSVKEAKIVVNGPGAAGTAITKMLLDMEPRELIVCDEKGILHENRRYKEAHKKELAVLTNKNKIRGNLKEAMMGADVFIGVSIGGIVSREMIESMNHNPVVFAMANPEPEIDPILAKKGGALVVGTGRSDYANQINNVLAFPGIFKGALRCKARDISNTMKIAAAKAIAEIIGDDELNPNYVIPKPFDERVAYCVAVAVERAAIREGLAR